MLLAALAAVGTRAQSASPLPSRTGLPYLITTVAGSGSSEPRLNDGLQAIFAGFAEPQGIAADSAGVIYVSEKDGHCVRRISTSGVILTFVGTGIAGIFGDGGTYVSEFQVPR